MNIRVREGLRTVFFMFVLSLVLIASVSALHLATAERVSRNAALFMQRAVMDVAGIPVPHDPDAVAQWYAASVESEPAGKPTAFRVRDAATGEVRSLAFMCRGRGLWGSITLLIGMSPDRSTFREFRILEQNETPGLGARIAEAWFMRQTFGKRGPFTLVPEGRRSALPTEIDGITGATVSSVAVRDMLNSLVHKDARQKEAAK